MKNVKKSIYFYYDKYMKNLEAIKDLVEIKELNLDSLIIDSKFCKKNNFNIDMYDYGNKQLYHLMVIKNNNDYILLDSFNQFLDLNRFKNKKVKCIIINNDGIFSFNDTIDIIENKNFKTINMYTSTISNKYFLLYPYKKIKDIQYDIYDVEIFDYINFFEAIANLINIINERIFIIKNKEV